MEPRTLNGAEVDESPFDDGDTLDTESVGAPLETTFATEDDLFASRPRFDVLYIPELERNVRIRYMTGKEVDAYRQSVTIGTGQNMTINQKGMRAKLAVLALANADGSRMFKDTDIHRVGTWESMVLERIFDRARKINGLTNDDTDTEEGNS